MINDSKKLLQEIKPPQRHLFEGYIEGKMGFVFVIRIIL